MTLLTLPVVANVSRSDEPSTIGPCSPGLSTLSGEAQGGFALMESQAGASLKARLAPSQSGESTQDHGKKQEDPQLQAMMALLLMTPETAMPSAADGQPVMTDQQMLAKALLTGGTPFNPQHMVLGNQPLHTDVTQAQQQAALQKLSAQKPVLAEITAAIKPRAENARPASSLTVAPQPAFGARVTGRQPRSENNHGTARGVAALNAIAASSPAMALAKASEAHAPAPVLALADSEEWGEKLSGLLKEQIHFQLNQQQQISTIRLDPPNLGKLEIAVLLEAGKLNVHITASQPAVLHSLRAISEELRQHLTEQHFDRVQVDVSADDQGKGQRGQQQQKQDDVILAQELTPDEHPDSTLSHLLTRV